MTDAEFWQIERDLWLGGADVFRRWVARESLMVFPAPVGILTGPTVVDSIASTPRWESVTFTETVLRRLGSDAVVLAYGVDALRPGGAPFHAFCSSCYVQQAGDWWLMQHQQTPTEPLT
jgi:Domain of unknown function (DUF4440)